jgi:3-phosphoshikimate 1-carboxyvinyltransferase
MTVTVSKSTACGTVVAPPSKSAGHRSLICAALSNGDSVIKNCGISNDITATAEVLKTLGASIYRDGDTVTVSGAKSDNKNIELFCNESGSTARFILPVAAALGAENITVTGSGRLPQRPFEIICDALRENGVKCSSNTLPITVNGKLTAGDFYIAGNVSSQYISGLLLALSITKGTSRIILTSPLESVAYVDMTVNELRHFGADIEKISDGYKISGKDGLIPLTRTVEGDWSQAAFFLTLGAISGDVTVTGLNMNSLQGDKEIVELLRRFGADIHLADTSVTVKKSELKGIIIDASQIPDLVPILAVTAAMSKGTTVIKGAARLKLKESDRLFETVKRLNAFGINATETTDGMIIEGGTPRGATIDSAGDHRIVMAFSVLASVCGDTVINGAEAISKSFPDFFSKFNSIGGKSNVICDR